MPGGLEAKIQEGGKQDIPLPDFPKFPACVGRQKRGAMQPSTGFRFHSANFILVWRIPAVNKYGGDGDFVRAQKFSEKG